MDSTFPVIWQIARPAQLALREDMRYLDNFLKLLEERLSARGHLVISFPFARVPWSRKGITLTFHMNGFEPNTWHYKDSFLKKWIQIDWLGHSGWHSNNVGMQLPSETSLLVKRRMQLPYRLDAYIESKSSKYTQGTDEIPVSSNGYVFFPLQKLQDDTTFFARFNLTDVIEKLAQAVARKNMELVIKRHPFCTSTRIEKILRDVSNNPIIHQVNGHVDDLIYHAKAIVTVNSSVGFETLLRDRKVITLGQAEYTPSSIKVYDLCELDAALDDACTLGSAGACREAAEEFILRSIFENDSADDVDCLIEIAEMRYNQMFGSIKNVIWPLETEIDFSENGMGYRFLLHGFSFPEEWGVWSSDELCSLVFTADSDVAARLNNVEFQFRGYVKPNWPECIFDIYFNGVIIANDIVINEGDGDRIMQFGIEIMTGINCISFQIKRPVRPIDLKTDFDTRKIGLGLIGMQLY